MEKTILNYRVIIEPEKYPSGDAVYNAYCPTLGVADYGDTVDEALVSIQDGIELAIETLASKGEGVPVDNIEQQIIASAKVIFPQKLKVQTA
ncbi:MAG: type II toxin-antitoxin system HicB family antitoxin [Candidatus Blackburnbacteria bacterium]|nr:type II toxin-antitoxin system HicB family antitoxin [Candidatus Blackburnbacteria bacterium]